MRTLAIPPRGPSRPINYWVFEVLTAICSLVVTMSAQASNAIEERIRHIRDDLLPPMFIEGTQARRNLRVAVTRAKRRATLLTPVGARCPIL